MQRNLRFLYLVLAALAFANLPLIAPAPAAGQSLKPDLVVSQLAYEQVRQETDASGGKYWIFNIIVHVRNAGTANAGASKLLLERNNGAGGSFQQACPTCVIDVPALHPGGEAVLPPLHYEGLEPLIKGKLC